MRENPGPPPEEMGVDMTEKNLDLVDIEKKEEFSVETAQNILRQELNIEEGADNDSIKKNVETEIGSESFLQKIRNNPLLKRSIQIMAFTFLFIKGQEAYGKTVSEESNRDEEIKITEDVKKEELDEKTQEILESIDLYQELKDDPNVDLKIVEDPTLYDQGIYASFVPDANIFKYSGTIKLTPYQDLAPEDTSAYESTLYHELVHVQQEYKLFQYFSGNDNEQKIPKWKMKYYYANIPEEERIHIGAELDAHFRQALFEKEKQGKVNESTLAGFFSNYMTIQRTKAFNDYEEIKKFVEEAYDKISEISGQTLESFIDTRSEKN